MELTPPDDTSITTLWLGNVDAEISEQDIRDVIYPYGHILNINVVRAGKCAFVEYASREMAEYAASQLYKALMIKGKVISVNWARPRAQALVGSAGAGGGAFAVGNAPVAMLPPPGMDAADVGAYALPDAPLPILQPPPPPGPPPAGPGATAPAPSAPAAVGSVRSLEEANGGDDSNVGDEDGGEKKRRAVDHGGSVPQRASSAAALYPSMNPARLGSKA
jgi:pre-mRNA-splicing factor RBM22/SLT11